MGEEEKKETASPNNVIKGGNEPTFSAAMAEDPVLRTPPRAANDNAIASALKGGGYSNGTNGSNNNNNNNNNANSSSEHQHHRHATTSSGVISLQDVLSSGGGPHELEAETQILRAVEKITGQAHMRPVDPETAQLYSAIAAQDRDARTSQRLEELQIEAEEDALFPTTPHAPTPTANNVTTPATNTAPMAPPSESSADTTNTAKRMKARSNFKSLVRRSIELNHENGNVEETLFGLSSALSQMDHEGAYNKRHHNREIGSFDTTLSSADKLANLTVGGALSKTVEQDDEDDDDDDELSILADGPAVVGDLEEGGGNTGGDAAAASNNGNNNKGPPEATDSDESSSEDITKSGRKKKKRKKRSALDTAKDELREEFELFNEFLGGKKRQIRYYARMVFLFIMLPGLFMAGLLFYFVEEFDTDPLTGLVVPGQDASISWWILFIACRQVVTLTMALITQALVIDFLVLGSRISILRWLGPIPTLLIVQSKGWPFISIFWGTYNLILLSGDARYARHWLYFQDYIDLFNEQNPGGNVIDSSTNYSILRLMIIVGVCVSIKRLAVGLFLGRQTFAHFGKELATVMKNMVLVGKVATLSREIENDRELYEQESVADDPRLRSNTLTDFISNEADAALEEEEEDAKNNQAAPSAADAATAFMAKRQRASSWSAISTRSRLLSKSEASIDASSLSPPPGDDFTESEQVQISELLDAWEEPVRAQDTEERKITIGSVMQFRQALTFMKRKYPFLPAFGPADSRERCIESAQAVYDRLMIRTPHSRVLPFETLALLAKNEDGGIDSEKAKDLIKIFRPERDGSLGKLEFIKSIDQVYKQLRLLSANISNSSQIDKAIETIINIGFYVFMGCIVLISFGEDPRAIFLSFSSVALGFAFLFSASAAKYFEGVLFILVQRPYGVGDRIHLSDPQNETSADGSSCWIVEKVSLTTTTVFWGTTNEKATLSNGAIANMRVINAARSPNATLYVTMKFGIDTPYEKIAIFRSAVEQFLKDRPREWLTFIGFRPTEVVVDQAYIGYKIIAQHRNHWQGIGGILESKASLTTYCLEVAKKLEMRYHAPSLPVDLTMASSASGAFAALRGNSPRGGLNKQKLDDALAASMQAMPRRAHAAFAGEGDE